MDKAWVRVHWVPRRSLYNPEGLKEMSDERLFPGKEELKKERLTIYVVEYKNKDGTVERRAGMFQDQIHLSLIHI